ncbi:MAG: HlyD family efflux transporter periplasmic adaptor subunit [Anaeromassilibacillus sp.]|nr:HlyD family efflux transporter periplasmic adaptor subunit [Anaeromassilibacillus sp.]MDY3780214.1 HlyD family efflux transporter periplasmic adaptor subunit [Candidatus Limousia pullorum]
MRRNKKKKLIAVISASLAVVLVAGIILLAVNAGGAPVKVASVSVINQGYWGGNSQISEYGNIVADMNQTINYDDSLTIKEIYVKEGDKVKVGDPLISYDTTLVEMEYDMKKMQIEGIGLKIQNLQAEIDQLKRNGTSSSAYGSSATTRAKIVPAGYKSGKFLSVKNVAAVTEKAFPEGQVYSEITENSVPYTGNGTKEEPYRYYIYPPEGKTTVNLSKEWIKKSLDEKSVSVFDTVDSAENPSKIVFSWEMDFETLSNLVGSGSIGTEIPPELQGKEILENISSLSSAYNYDTADGTAENPYKFLCAPGVSVDNVFMSDMLANGSVAVFQVVDSKENPQRILYSWTLDGQGGNTQQPTEPEEPQEPTEPEDPGIDIPAGPTQEEINKQIKEKEDNIKSLNLEKRNCELELKKLEQKVNGGVVNSTIDGTVKTVNDAEKAKLEGSPLIYVLGEDGIYVTGSVAETALDKVQKGTVITVTSWESGEVRQAEITGIGATPVEDGYFSGNPNMSYYPFTAVISEETNFKNGESVSISAEGVTSSGEIMEDIYLMQAFVREDQQGFYVFMKDENGLLKKQYVEIGRITDGAMEIKSGLSMEDEIAFPYGKDVKEGAKTVSVETLDEY